jgi:hypothetical protein
MSTNKDKIGNIIKIKIDDNTFGFGRIITGGFIEFYDFISTETQSEDSLEKIIGSKVIFTLSIHKSWKKNGNWEIIGNNSNDIPNIPDQFMQNLSDPTNIKIIDSSGSARKATLEEVQGVERLAVWEDNHVEDRLRDHFNGKPNAWVEQLKPKTSN